MDPSAQSTRSDPALREAGEGVAAGLPEDDFGTAVRRAMTGVEGTLPPLLVTEIAPSGSAEADDAAQAIVLLEAAERAERGVHRLGGTGPHVDVDTSRDQAAALAGGWLRASATERAAGLGDEAIMRWSASLVEIVDGWMREACDLYDAARTPDQYYAAAAGTRGTLGSLAAALGGLAAACEGRAVRSLAESGAKLALADKVRDDVAALSSTEPDAGGEPPGASLLSGVYTLPVILAADSEPKLRNSLGGAIQTDALADLVELIRFTDGPARAAGECDRLVDEALAEIEGLEAAERLSQHAIQVVEDCKEAVRR